MQTKMLMLGSMIVLLGCRNPGLPPLAPEDDAANPEAGIVARELPPDPFTRSAFEGEALDAKGGHEHHHHHGHGKAPAAEAPAAEAEPAPAEGEAGAEHQGHEGHTGHAGHTAGGRS